MCDELLCALLFNRHLILLPIDLFVLLLLHNFPRLFLPDLFLFFSHSEQKTITATKRDETKQATDNSLLLFHFQ